MQSFFYKVVTKQGIAKQGTRYAIDEQSLIAELQAEGYIPIRVLPASAKWFLGMELIKQPQLSRKDVLMFTNELAVLLDSGLPLDRALMILMNLSEDNTPLHNFVMRVLNKVKSGSSLTAALERRKSGTRPASKIISRFYISMIKAGEAGGNLGEVLTRLASYLESSQELKSTVTTALIYPCILLLMSLASLLMLLLFVVPQFQEMFASAGKALPLPTQIVIACATFLQQYWWLLLTGLVLTGIWIHKQLKHPLRRKHWHQQLLRIPLIAQIIQHQATAQFTRTLGTLLSNGVPLLNALTIARETVENLALVSDLLTVESNVKQGKTLSLALKEQHCLPEMAVQIIRTGEETGHLEEMLLKIADIYDKQLKTTLQRLLAILEPSLILSLGFLIAGIIVSILLAILSINDLAF